MLVTTDNKSKHHRLAVDEDDKLDKLDPTIRYLQKLGPNYLDVILKEADWMFKEDTTLALRVSWRAYMREPLNGLMLFVAIGLYGRRGGSRRTASTPSSRLFGKDRSVSLCGVFRAYYGRTRRGWTRLP
jgi:hypothetical protein